MQDLGLGALCHTQVVPLHAPVRVSAKRRLLAHCFFASQAHQIKSPILRQVRSPKNPAFDSTLSGLMEWFKQLTQRSRWRGNAGLDD
jgi:hypothetical protein